ncbi:nucleoside triphosphate pyrophosphohydrolase [Tepidibacter hydrothermalis]|uniref:Nucleoside triphosphate pyrophosphohydrolase n=1 Tax=Tepidibacter hydrothermalis TaxID=3036126 RepID=A0ABY8EGW1_9FIRM|nr:nucleoside triphosphate pyrophosphohydrolase [Tepidibacter hydrothermalis]WFD12185.1 nucleoside triphosphate pyrophosphohydrolase [Tepidibacter hydrothermalis]
MKTYDKIVRDKIPQIIDNAGKKFDIHIVSDDEAISYLDTKLDEEVKEFHEDNNLEELADVMEILFSLAKKMGYSEDDLLNKRLEKKESNGGFDKNIILTKVY